MRVTGENPILPFCDLLVGLTDKQKIEPATIQLGLRLSQAIKGAVILRFVIANTVTMKILEVNIFTDVFWKKSRSRRL